MDLSIYKKLKAAYGFKLEDLHESAHRQIDDRYNSLIQHQIYLTSGTDGLHHLFISVNSANYSIDNFNSHNPRELVVRMNEATLCVYILSDQQLQEGKDPEDGLHTSIEVSPSEIRYKIGLLNRKVPGIVYDQKDLESTDRLDPDELKRRASIVETTALGASTSSNIVSKLQDCSSEGSKWLSRAFPKWENAIQYVLLSNIVLIEDVRTGVCKNVTLAADKEVVAFSTKYLPKHNSSYPIFVIGSEEAALLAPECAKIYSKAVLESRVIEDAKTKVVRKTGNNTGEIDIPNLSISTRSLVRDDYLLANRHLYFADTTFHLWLSKSILERTFNHRIGKNIGALLGAHYDGKLGIVKWWLSGGWVLKHITGSVRIAVASVAVEVDFYGRSKFDAMGYVDLECTHVEIGSMDAFHEKFDFTLNSRLFVSWRDGKVIFGGGFKNVKYEKWRSFIRFILDKYVHNWKYVVARMIVDFVIGRILKFFVEEEITNAMGSISLELLDVSELPIIGDHFRSNLRDTRNNPMIVGYASAVNGGIELIVGTGDG